MSWQAVRMALRLGQERDLTPTQRLLLVSLANHWNEQRQYAWPAVPTLAEEVGCSERTVQRDLDVLEKEFLVMIHRRRGGRQRPSFYELLFMNAETVTPATRKGDSVSVKGDSVSVKGDTVTPDPPKEPPTETPTETPTPPHDQESDAAQGSDREKQQVGSGNGRRPEPIPAEELT